MTTCAECLTELSTMRMADMRAGSAIALHCAACPNCSSVAQEIAYAERRLSTALSDARSGFTPEELSDASLTGSERDRRKHVGRWVRGILAVAGCVAFWFFMDRVFVPGVDSSGPIYTETITLRCITPQQASEIATPYLRSRGSVYTTKGLSLVTVRGQLDEFRRAVAQIKSLDDAGTCTLPAAGSSGIHGTGVPGSTSTDKPGKD